MTQKYELVKESVIEEDYSGVNLYRIRALRDFGKVKKGDLGGYIEKEDNLSHEGNCWIYNDAKVYGCAKVSDNAVVMDDSSVYGHARVFGDAVIQGGVQIYDKATIFGNAKVYDNAEVYGNTKVYDKAFICGNVNIQGDTIIYGNSQVSGNAYVGGDAIINGNARIRDNALIRGTAYIGGNADISSDMIVDDNALILGEFDIISITPMVLGRLSNSSSITFYRNNKNEICIVTHYSSSKLIDDVDLNNIKDENYKNKFISLIDAVKIWLS